LIISRSSGVRNDRGRAQAVRWRAENRHPHAVALGDPWNTVVVRLIVTSLVAVVAVAVATFAVSTASASGGLGLRFDRASARPGGYVTGTGVTLWFGSARGITAYLIPTHLRAFRPGYTGVQPVLLTPPKHGVWKLRSLSLRRHRLFIRFRVPNVPPGNYTIGWQCMTCTSGGDFFAQVLWDTPWTGKPGFVIRIIR
jgi:hypothetical protein